MNPETLGCYWDPQWARAYGDMKAGSEGMYWMETIKETREKTPYKVKVMFRGKAVLAWDMPGEEQPTDEEVATTIRGKTRTLKS